MTKYEQKLQSFRPQDEIQQTVDIDDHGYKFILTASHGYLIIPPTDKYAANALHFCKYGYIGKSAIYLEEDCEVPRFLNFIDSLKEKK